MMLACSAAWWMNLSGAGLRLSLPTGRYIALGTMRQREPSGGSSAAAASRQNSEGIRPVAPQVLPAGEGRPGWSPRTPSCSCPRVSLCPATPRTLMYYPKRCVNAGAAAVRRRAPAPEGVGVWGSIVVQLKSNDP